MTEVRWGVLSTANIATEQVIPAIQAAARCRVTAIASRNLDRARETAGKLGIEQAYGSYGQLLNDPDIDAVYIPLPNHLHAEWSLAAARAGKHILCEKPIALSVAETETMIAAAEPSLTPEQSKMPSGPAMSGAHAMVSFETSLRNWARGLSAPFL